VKRTEHVRAAWLPLSQTSSGDSNHCGITIVNPHNKGAGASVTSAKLGVIIGIILAIPLSVVANLITPYVREWWSTTSQERLNHRIDRLRILLKEFEQSWTFTEQEWVIVRNLAVYTQVVLTFLELVFLCFACTVMFVQEPLVRLFGHFRPTFISIMFMTGYLATGLFSLLIARKRNEMRRMHTEPGRRDLREELNKLEAALLKSKQLDIFATRYLDHENLRNKRPMRTTR
jgi:hypothetical protein